MTPFFFTCFCKVCLFLFPVLMKVSVLQLSAIVSGKLIQLASSEPKEYSATVPNSASVPNLDNAAGIKESKKLGNLLKLNSINVKLKQTTTVANYGPETHTTRE